MEVNFDLAQPRATEVGQGVEVLGPILLCGEEEGVLWRSPVGVPMTRSQARQTLRPGTDALPLHGDARISVRGLEVVREAEEDVEQGAMTGLSAAPPNRAQIAREPEMRVPRKTTRNHGRMPLCLARRA
jgi:hypothetical protein